MITLSICIPSYNRFEKLCETIDIILESESDDFDIVIVDNCSPRNIENYICNDARIKIIHRDNPVRGERSVNECVSYADGKYALLLLDKDVITGKYITDLIKVLKRNDITGGYCIINSFGNSYKIIKHNPILQFGYLSKHPSGNIYRTELAKEFVMNEDMLIESNPFGFEYCMAYVASKGEMLLYDKPIVSSQLSNTSEKVEKSLSFNPKMGNVYYFPQNRIAEFKSYATHLDKLEINSDLKKKKFQNLYISTLKNVTLIYRQIMKNKSICYHYGHNTKFITLFEMIGNIIKVNKAMNEVDVSYMNKTEKKMMKKRIYQKIPKKIILKIIKR